MENLKQRAVQAAERFLHHRGYDVLDVGWKSPAGDIDIVARDGDDLVFVEVAARDGAAAGFPPSRNQGELRARRERAALAYLAEKGADEGPVRLYSSIKKSTFRSAGFRHFAGKRRRTSHPSLPISRASAPRPSSCSGR